MRNIYKILIHSVVIAACLFSAGGFFIPVHAAQRSAQHGHDLQPFDIEGTPKIANWNFAYSINSEEEVERLAKWDLIIADIHQETNSRKRLERIKELNPDIIILAYISLADIRPDAAELEEGTARKYIGDQLTETPDWILHRADGTNAEWWPTFYIFNVTDQAPRNPQGQRYNEFLPDFVRDSVIKDPIWDGVFYDNLWEGVSFVGNDIDLNNDGVAESQEDMDAIWRAGVEKILKKTYQYSEQYRKDDFYVTGNGGVGYYKTINGTGFEHFPTTIYGPWVDSLKQYDFILTKAQAEQIAILNTNVGNTGNRENFRKFRFGLTSSLLNDGYYSFDNGDKSHEEKWYYDEYDAVVGKPISGAYNLLKPNDATTKRRGLWRRDFKDAIVLVNSTNKKFKINLRTGFEKINGTQDTSVNSGSLVNSIVLDKKDGIVLLRRLTQVTDATFVNGAYAKVFHSNGKQARKSFFSFDGRFTGNAQIHTIEDKGITVVADNTWVRVYDHRNQQIGAFAPYGTDFKGGVNIQVSRLTGKKKYSIVTGRRSGSPLIKIYSLKGKLTNPGCFAFDKNFQGGVNIAAGDVNGDRKMEILASPARNGSPQIRVFNHKCKLASGGFNAFPKEWKTGLSIAVGDIDGNGRSEIIAAPGPGGAPQVKVFNRKGRLVSPAFYAYDKKDRSGVFLSVAHVEGRTSAQIVTYSFALFDQL